VGSLGSGELVILALLGAMLLLPGIVAIVLLARVAKKSPPSGG
jgi:hypothetical protein